MSDTPQQYLFCILSEMKQAANICLISYGLSTVSMETFDFAEKMPHLKHLKNMQGMNE